MDLLNTQKPRYARVEGSTSSISQQWNTPLVKQIMIFLSVLLACILSFTAGRYTSSGRNASISSSSSSSINPGYGIPISTHKHPFTYNRTFGSPPNASTNAAWAALFPEQGGYLTHPTYAPTRSALSVFHQLHCLDGLRTALWTIYDHATTQTALLDPASLPDHLAPPHMRHCIDLLRQSLMCNPDLAAERVNVRLGGVTGFGTMHVCRDWEELVGFVAQWEYYGLSAEEVARKKERVGMGGHGGGHDTGEHAASEEHHHGS
ncbi:hypothetical protein EJ05DRAFT_368578 [Pseudovirgaria hyperparasitica]|uniref:Tat pathway signal sequence n=1 Tax=Pseudovirgaria hyperparasitica TaxID=470096 RepID=A0A6A6W8E8_9PEZI|nr:uncharacterized protein EJ05DRAFT_368578 [Pseudovirgaria hyperparasitica]KAF2757847.1 hypothetical protein EJ05DRAFT_368578 [Pseudovirgaria hyperparasitica]